MSGEIRKDERGQLRNLQFPGNRFAAPRWSRLGYRQRGFAPISSRHVLWARTIAAKFAVGKSSSTWQPATMMHTRMAGMGNVSLRVFLTQNFLRQNLESATWNLTTEQVARLDAASNVARTYPYWHQAQFAERNPLPVPDAR